MPSFVRGQSVWMWSKEFPRGTHDFGGECLKQNYSPLIEEKEGM